MDCSSLQMEQSGRFVVTGLRHLLKLGVRNAEQETCCKRVFPGCFFSHDLRPNYDDDSTTYYVAQDVKTKKCTIVDQKPTDTTTVTILGDGACLQDPH